MKSAFRWIWTITTGIIILHGVKAATTTTTESNDDDSTETTTVTTTFFSDSDPVTEKYRTGSTKISTNVPTTTVAEKMTANELSTTEVIFIVVMSLFGILILALIGWLVALTLFLKKVHHSMKMMDNRVTVLRMAIELPRKESVLPEKESEEETDFSSLGASLPHNRRKASAPELSFPGGGHIYSSPSNNLQVRRPSLPVTPSQYRGPNSPVRQSPPLHAIEENEDMETLKSKLNHFVKVDSGIQEEEENLYENQLVVQQNNAAYTGNIL